MAVVFPLGEGVSPKKDRAFLKKYLVGFSMSAISPPLLFIRALATSESAVPVVVSLLTTALWTAGEVLPEFGEEGKNIRGNENCYCQAAMTN